MNHPRQQCRVEDIAAYIDGELTASRELELDLHFVACSHCAAELNDQKQFLRTLDVTLKAERDLELPEDFTKQVIAQAESSVNGIRRPAEFFNAVFITVAIGLFVLFATGADAARIVSIVDQISAVGTFFGHMVYSFFVGVAIVIRSTASQLDGGSSTAILLALGAGAFSLYISRKVLTTRGI